MAVLYVIALSQQYAGGSISGYIQHSPNMISNQLCNNMLLQFNSSVYLLQGQFYLYTFRLVQFSSHKCYCLSVLAQKVCYNSLWKKKKKKKKEYPAYPALFLVMSILEKYLLRHLIIIIPMVIQLLPCTIQLHKCSGQPTCLPYYIVSFRPHQQFLDDNLCHVSFIGANLIMYCCM